MYSHCDSQYASTAANVQLFAHGISLFESSNYWKNIIRPLTPNEVEKIFPDPTNITSSANKIELHYLNDLTYKLKNPIIISIEILSDDEYLACFNEADISFTGGSVSEAIRELLIEIVEIYKLYKSTDKLGPKPKKQLSVLENYIA